MITGITQESVKVQFLEKRSYQNFFPRFDEYLCKPNAMPSLLEHCKGAAKFMQTYIDELDLGKWPSIYSDSMITQSNTNIMLV